MKNNIHTISLKPLSLVLVDDHIPPKNTIPRAFSLLEIRRMCVGDYRTTGRWNGRCFGRGIRVRLGIEDGHFLIFAILLGLKNGNIFAGRIKDGPDLRFFRGRVQTLVGLQFCHEVVNFNAKGLFAILYLAI